VEITRESPVRPPTRDRAPARKGESTLVADIGILDFLRMPFDMKPHCAPFRRGWIQIYGVDKEKAGSSHELKNLGKMVDYLS